ncbi:MAG TPA: biopolymer transporter ExbD [Pirellulales bacterium]|nr:biopolymer transporter ExbD [Pirellulales bacterium]
MRKRKKGKEEVELNLAAMLDMAFQLLTFFILTFKPAPIEGQITLRMPPPQSITPVVSGKEAGKDDKSTDPLKGLKTLIITVLPNGAGGLGQMMVGEETLGGLAMLDTRLREIFGNAGTPFDQVVVQVAPDLRYDALMSVIDVCTKQTLPNGEPLSKLSFVDLSGKAE